MEQTKRRTKVQSVALNEYLLERAGVLVDSGKFGSISDVIVTALTEFLVKYDAIKIGKNQNIEASFAEEFLKEIIQTEEGKKLLASICKSKSQ